MEAVAVVAAAGTGERLGRGSPKALVELADRPMGAWCLAAFAASTSVARAVVAAPPGFEREFEELAAKAAPKLAVEVVAGGASRSESVANALAAAHDPSIVVVHDAARPLVTAKLIDHCVAELERLGCDGVVAATPVTDTVKQVGASGRVSATLERGELWSVQTPQVFRYDVLRRVLSAERSGGSASGGPALAVAYDDAQLVEAAGGDVRVVEAPSDNLKVTSPLDARVAELLLADRC